MLSSGDDGFEALLPVDCAGEVGGVRVGGMHIGSLGGANWGSSDGKRSVMGASTGLAEEGAKSRPLLLSEPGGVMTEFSELAGTVLMDSPANGGFGGTHEQ